MSKNQQEPTEQPTGMGDAIRAYRRSLGLSQHDLAKQIGTSQSVISAWECGRFDHSNRSLIEKIRGIVQEKPDNELGDTIRTYRKSLGMLQRALADMLGVSVSTICSWEHGHTTPSKRQLNQIANVLKIPAEALSVDMEEPDAQEKIVVRVEVPPIR